MSNQIFTQMEGTKNGSELFKATNYLDTKGKWEMKARFHQVIKYLDGKFEQSTDTEHRKYVHES